MLSCSMLKQVDKKKETVKKENTTTAQVVKYELDYLPNDMLEVPQLQLIHDTIINSNNLKLEVKNNKVTCASKGRKKISKTISDVISRTTENTSKEEKNKNVDVKQDRSIYIMILLALILVFLIVDKIKR